MIFQQFYLGCLAHASYFIADETTRTAAVVDPRRDIDIYLEEAARIGADIRHVFLTHFHADFIAGHLELRDRTGATIYLGAAARAEYPFVPLRDGDAVELGRVRMQALETPGHTAESISILVFDLGPGGFAPPDPPTRSLAGAPAPRSARVAHSRSLVRASTPEPYAVLTGDTLFIGDVGRPDLRASLGWSALSLGRMLYDSVHSKLLPLPDGTLVYPAHGAGSLCGKHISKDTVSTIGDERRTNYALQPMTQDAFVALVTADQPDAPAYFTYDAVLNSKERPTLDAVLTRELRPLALDEALTLASAGAQLLDVRDPNDFAQAHVNGSINIGLGGQYATWAGSLLDRERPIVVIAEPGREAEAALRLGRIGFDHVAGYLDGGLQALEGRDDLVGATERVTPAELAAASGPRAIIDVRTSSERQVKSIEGSLSLPLSQLQQRLGELPRDRRLVVHCAGGYRSSIAASLLKRAGFRDVAELAGGLAAWEAAKLPLTPLA